MSHELRTPMNGIIGMATLLCESSLDADDLDMADMLKSSAISLMSILNDILDFSKIEDGKLDIECIDFEISTLLDRIVNLLSIKAVEKGLELKLKIGKDVPQYIYGDPGRIKQILINLINNAIKFTSKGEICIDVELQQETNTHVTIIFHITDTGIGIQKKQMERLFKPFSQVDDSLTRKYGGTGLGLAISKQLVELMEGKIGVESEDGKGARFWFTIVIPKQENMTCDDTYDPQQRPHQEEINHAQLTIDKSTHNNDCRILIVEDSFLNQKVTTLFLKKNKEITKIDIANNGIEAIDLLEKQTYDLVLMDIQMPKMNGIETTRIIRDPNSNVLDHHVPIIAMTTNASQKDKQICIDAQVNDFISKPIIGNKIRNILEKYVLQGQA